MFGQIDLPVRHLLQTAPESLDHLKEARLLFETALVRLAAERARSTDIARLRSALSDLQACKGRQPEFTRADMEFHIAIASVSGNPLLESASRALLTWLSEYHADLVSVPGADEITLSEHRTILRRIEEHDPERAVRAMKAHLTRASEMYRRVAVRKDR
jgi:DNA-binding FadR family transcriptional regulator